MSNYEENLKRNKIKTKTAYDKNGNSKLIILSKPNNFHNEFKVVEIRNTKGVVTEMILPK